MEDRHSGNLSRFLQIGNTQKKTHERLIEHKQKLDKLLLERKRVGKRMVMVKDKISYMKVDEMNQHTNSGK